MPGGFRSPHPDAGALEGPVGAMVGPAGSRTREHDDVKVLVADELSPEGLQTLRSAPELTVEVKLGLEPAALKAIVGQYEVLAVRSATKVTAETLENPGRLKLIARAGVGVDNIDVGAATRKGVVVMNT